MYNEKHRSCCQVCSTMIDLMHDYIATSYEANMPEGKIWQIGRHASRTKQCQNNGSPYAMAFSALVALAIDVRGEDGEGGEGDESLTDPGETAAGTQNRVRMTCISFSFCA